MQSPAEVQPAMKMLFTAKLDVADRQDAYAALASALDGILQGQREFRAAELLVRPSALLAEAPVLVPALRSYIMRQVSGVLCAERGQSPQPISVTRMNRRRVETHKTGGTYDTVYDGSLPDRSRYLAPYSG